MNKYFNFLHRKNLFSLDQKILYSSSNQKDKFYIQKKVNKKILYVIPKSLTRHLIQSSKSSHSNLTHSLRLISYFHLLCGLNPKSPFLQILDRIHSSISNENSTPKDLLYLYLPLLLKNPSFKDAYQDLSFSLKSDLSGLSVLAQDIPTIISLFSKSYITINDESLRSANSHFIATKILASSISKLLYLKLYNTLICFIKSSDYPMDKTVKVAILVHLIKFSTLEFVKAFFTVKNTTPIDERLAFSNPHPLAGSFPTSPSPIQVAIAHGNFEVFKLFLKLQKVPVQKIANRENMNLAQKSLEEAIQDKKTNLVQNYKNIINLIQENLKSLEVYENMCNYIEQKKFARNPLLN